MTESQAAYLFHSFTREDSARLLSALPDSSPKTFETEWLEFKSGRVQENDFLRIWSKAVGAFANTGGGVVVWGIGAAYDVETKVDAAKNLQFVEDVNAFCTKLRNATHSILDPPLQGIEIVPIPMQPRGDEGFVVCYVPEGRHKPYESLKTEHRFFMRSGDSSRSIPLKLLRLLFYPSLNTRAQVGISAEDAFEKGHPQNEPLKKFTFRVMNVGKRSMEKPYLGVDSGAVSTFTGTTGCLIEGETFVNLKMDSLHPGMWDEAHVYVDGWTLKGRVRFTLYLYQLNQEPESVTFIYDFSHNEFYDETLVLPDVLTLTFGNDS